MPRHTVAELTSFTAHKQATKPRKIENNTLRFTDDDGNICYQLHRTIVVRHHPDNTYTLDSGGWLTVTTRDRINAYSPARLFSRKGEWFLSEGVPFRDGMRIDANGSPL